MIKKNGIFAIRYWLVRVTVLALAIHTAGCLTVFAWYIKPGTPFSRTAPPPAPDYTNPAFWLALPERPDEADLVPRELQDRDAQNTALADVFYVHPTTYKSSDGWNADARTYDLEINGLRPMWQATVFNGSAKVFAPKYRQATLYSFVDRPGQGDRALALAAGDVLAAFDYYRKHLNHGRPYILAGHSQGSGHLVTLLQTRGEMRADRRFIAAYLIGATVQSSDFEGLPVCDRSDATRCYVTWNTKAWGTQPEDLALSHRDVSTSVCVNPLSWRHDDRPAERSLHQGALRRDFATIDYEYLDAKCNRGLLWARLPADNTYQSTWFPENLHVMDYNLFYNNIRTNVRTRIEAFARR